MIAPGGTRPQGPAERDGEEDPARHVSAPHPAGRWRRTAARLGAGAAAEPPQRRFVPAGVIGRPMIRRECGHAWPTKSCNVTAHPFVVSGGQTAWTMAHDWRMAPIVNRTGGF